MPAKTNLISTTLRIDSLHMDRADAISRLIKRDRSYLIRALIDHAWKRLAPRGKVMDRAAASTLLDELGLL